jgi:argonaute-like protein implicated in RNA metabolism and viral defense
MGDIVKLIEKIVDKAESKENKLEQISKFDEAIKMLEILEKSEKLTYNFPLTDTLGKQTYSNLNKKYAL